MIELIEAPLEDPNLHLVEAMIERAIVVGLESEVVQSFGDYRALGESVANAAATALSDWDL